MAIVIILVLMMLILLYHFPSLPRIVARPVNKLLSSIWMPDTSRVSKETLQRIKELYIDHDIPEETALLIAAQEEGLTEEEILSSANVVDAKDLIALLTGTKTNRLKTIGKLLLKPWKTKRY